MHSSGKVKEPIMMRKVTIVRIRVRQRIQGFAESRKIKLPKLSKLKKEPNAEEKSPKQRPRVRNNTTTIKIPEGSQINSEEGR